MEGYNPYVIMAAASQLRRQGYIELLIATVLGAVIGTWAGYLARADSAGILVVSLVLGSLVGLGIGSGRWFMLNTVAQMVLCVAKIEQNTRPAEEQRELNRQLQVAEAK